MEVASFVLGIVAIVMVAMVTVIIVGIVKILKLTKQVKDLETTFFQSRADLYRNIEERIQPIWRQFEDTGRDITMVDKTLQNKMENELKGVHTNTKRYIDSRIDKLIDTYFEHVGAKTPPKINKEIING
jgi:predicted PurR-regulated permease PerM